MSRPADVVWLTQDLHTDPMAEFGAEGSPAPALPQPEPRAARPIGVPQGRWFVGVAVLALLTLVQAPFVVLWALHASNDAPPVTIEVVRPVTTFAATPALPVETTIPLPVRPAPARPVPAGALSGWVHVEVPFTMRISEDGRLVGTTDVERLMLPVGSHTLDLRSDELQFATRQTVVVSAGEASPLLVRLPSASLSINAKPWADVWVDGERVGETPIGTLMRPIGRHEVVLRHPELGERRVSVMVSLAQPVRVSVDFRAGK